jgi:hypothetical protein
MKWLFFIKTIKTKDKKKEMINMVLTNVNLEKIEIKKYNLDLESIANIELDILQCFNNNIAMKDKVYIVCDKKDDDEYNFIKKNMIKINKRITDIIDYNSFKIIFEENDNMIKIIDKEYMCGV